MKVIMMAVVLLAAGTLIMTNGLEVKKVILPNIQSKKLKAYAVVDSEANSEVSGIVKSRKYNDVYWIHNDSGDKTIIYAINSEGKMYLSDRYKSTMGTFIPDAVNFDWEDITNDDKGNVIIADFGNNCQCRNDLVFYIISEPDPSQEQTTVKQKIFFKYPDQKEIPAPKNDQNYDAEAVFFACGKIHVLSKDRSDTYTRLYRLDKTDPFVVNNLTLLDAFDAGGKVTGADASHDGKRLAVLTYKAVWLFEVSDDKSSWFDGKISYLPFKADQTEGICFSGNNELIVTDEGGGKLYKINTNELVEVRRSEEK